MSGAEFATVVINGVFSVTLAGLAVRHLLRAESFKIEGATNKLIAAFLIITGGGVLIVTGLLLAEDFKKSLATASVLFGGFVLVGYHFIMKFFVLPED